MNSNGLASLEIPLLTKMYWATEALGFIDKATEEANDRIPREIWRRFRSPAAAGDYLDRNRPEWAHVDSDTFDALKELYR